MTSKANPLWPVFIAVVISCAGILLGSILFQTNDNLQTQALNVQPVASQIMADGVVASQNEATLHFQTGGQLASLPVKEGDTVRAGQTVAQLDTYLLQRQLTQTLNLYRSTRDTFDQTQQNQGNNVIQNTQQKTTGNSDTSYLNDVAKRIVDQNQANLDNSVIAVESANYALQLSSLTSPINGVVTHEDVKTAGVAVSPTTTFVVDDPNALVFKANVSENDIDFVSEGSLVTITIGNNNSRKLSGTVSKIYPQKVTLPSGDKVYVVDISSDDLKANTQLGQAGSVLIQSNAQTTAILVPSWLVLGHQYIWVVDNNNQAVLRQVTVGKTHGSSIEILSGLLPQDKVISNPANVAKTKYRII